MFSYLHHIGDFNRATRHLSRIERSIYRDMIELYYESEKPLPLDVTKICRAVIAISTDELTAVEQALNEFFHKTERGYVHVRCELEMDRYRSNSNQRSEAGKKSAALRAAKRQQILNGNPTDVERALQRDANENPTNQLTYNQLTDNLNNNSVDSLSGSTLPTPEEPKPQLPQAATPKSKGTRLPDDWKPTRDYWDAALKIKPDLSREWFIEVAHGFKDYWIAKTGKDATKADWLATWRNWLRREVKNAKGGSGTAGKKSYGEQRAELFDGLTDYERATNF